VPPLWKIGIQDLHMICIELPLSWCYPGNLYQLIIF
jgi:hypothetical protein